MGEAGEGWFAPRNAQRRREILKLVRAGRLSICQDYHAAAYIFLHGPRLAHYRRAHRFAQRAVALGCRKSRWLYAATLDRALLTAGKKQVFGTQFLKDVAGQWQLAPIDPTVVTDQERQLHGVPPLARSVLDYRRRMKIWSLPGQR